MFSSSLLNELLHHHYGNVFRNIHPLEQTFLRDFLENALPRQTNKTLKQALKEEQQALGETAAAVEQKQGSSTNTTTAMAKEQPKQQEAVATSQSQPIEKEIERDQFFKDIRIADDKPQKYKFEYVNRQVYEDGKDPVSEINMHFKDQYGQEKFQVKRKIGDKQEIRQAYRKNQEDKLQKKFVYENTKEQEFANEWANIGFKDQQMAKQLEF